MNGLNLEQEAALAIAWSEQNRLPRDFTDLNMSSAFIALREKGYVNLDTDMNHHLVFLKSVSQSGGDHYGQARSQRRGFAAVDDDADGLMMILAAEDKSLKRRGEPRFVKTDILSADNYAELSRNGLIEVQWADDAPYIVSVTDKGRSYAEGWFLDANESGVMIEITNNNINNNSADANIKDVTLGATVSSLIDLDIDATIKEDAERAVKELDDAAKNKNITKFSEKLEDLASIAKSSTGIASAVLPFVGTALSTLFR